MSDSMLDIGNLAKGQGNSESEPELEHLKNEVDQSDDTPPDDAENRALVLTKRTDHIVVQDPDMAWIQATQSLQRNLIRSLQEYKLTWRQKRSLAAQRERMIQEVADQYVSYLREEAKLASDAALKAREAILRQELAKLRSQLYTELAELTGSTVTEIEKIAQEHISEMTSPIIQEAYAKFIMTKIFDLLEQSS
ncbi:MAG: hypothetical protein D6732_27815 [Methanobacteriota archaeon]|nr:MAG: hypothetical protein D6732_27815 [Euryarchaeota archaeon]